MSRRSLPLAAVAVALVLAGCGDDPAPEAPAELAPPTTAEAAPANPTEAAEALGALAVIEALKKAGLPVSNMAEQDENTDPNNRLGRPGGYTSRASADVPGGDTEADKYSIDRGLVVEVFTTVEDANARSKFIQDALKGAQILGTEYHYQAKDKRILVRVTGTVKPSQAKKFETAVAAL